MTEWHLGHVPGTVLVDKTELDDLRAKNERLRAALTQIAEASWPYDPDAVTTEHAMQRVALRALGLQ